MMRFNEIFVAKILGWYNDMIYAQGSFLQLKD
jgi:hypothetical protein